ncbi:hypothetical protein FGADI_4753 [Fusarium gaditjirri]|uniref:Cylicin II n=1 Tax=Fusarium gaditjirri TaxID=282569 RepID=A0A8H4WZ88_9HYPO|nr:hypothetical protein FGADI_4753 [Fusarium gaditjirri]
MAPGLKPQARKRGRPANASKQAPSASQDRPDEYEADVEEAARPRQRGRPKKYAQGDAPKEEVAQAENPKKKRGRPSLKDKNAEKSPENAAQPKRKRGRPSLEKNQDEQEAGPETVEETTQPKRKRGRPSLEKTQNEQPEQEIEDAGKQKRKKKSKEKKTEEPEEEPRSWKKGRKAAQQPEPDTEDPEAETETAPRKRRRREAKELEPEPDQEKQPRRSPRNSLHDLGEDANNKGNKTDKSKKKKGHVAQENAEDQSEQAPKRRGRPRGGRPSTENANEPQEEQQETNKKKRRGKEKDDAPSDSDESLASPPKPYIHIAPFKRTIRSSKIAADWTGLAGASLPTTKSILKLAQQPILQRMAPTNNRRTHTSAALHLVYRRMERKLARGLPFPPGNASTTTKRRLDADGGRALELDFEAVLDGKAALERQLVPGMHAVELLKTEKERMERELERDYEKLRNLEANARAQTRERKDLFRKAHVLAPISRPASKDQDTTFITDNKDEGSLRDIVDTPLEPIALQLADHVESIRGNLQQADGLTPQLSRTKAALQDVLQRYLDEGSYEQVVLG